MLHAYGSICNQTHNKLKKKTITANDCGQNVFAQNVNILILTPHYKHLRKTLILYYILLLLVFVLMRWQRKALQTFQVWSGIALRDHILFKKNVTVMRAEHRTVCKTHTHTHTCLANIILYLETNNSTLFIVTVISSWIIIYPQHRLAFRTKNRQFPATIFVTSSLHNVTSLFF